MIEVCYLLRRDEDGVEFVMSIRVERGAKKGHKGPLSKTEVREARRMLRWAIRDAGYTVVRRATAREAAGADVGTQEFDV